jgi:hypothetical protein
VRWIRVSYPMGCMASLYLNLVFSPRIPEADVAYNLVTLDTNHCTRHEVQGPPMLTLLLPEEHHSACRIRQVIATDGLL